MAVDVVGIGVRVGDFGAGGWFFRRVAIRSTCCFLWSRIVADDAVSSVGIADWSDEYIFPWPP